MAYREYIGSRYVPIFGRKGEDTTNWDNLAPYEPLTVVTYQGNSYISRQYVPAGIEITNTNYWVSTGVYNAQVEAYRREVEEYAETVSEYARLSTVNFTNVQDMITSPSNLVIGAVCITGCFADMENGGSSVYVVSESGSDNGYDSFKSVSHDYYFNRVKTKEVNISELGAIRGEDIADILNYAIQAYSVVKVSGGTYSLTKQIAINNEVDIIGTWHETYLNCYQSNCFVINSRYVNIEGFIVYGSSEPTIPNSYSAIVMPSDNDAYYISVEKCWFFRFNKGVIKADNAGAMWNTSFTFVRFSQCNYGMDLNSVASFSNYFNNVYFDAIKVRDMIVNNDVGSTFVNCNFGAIQLPMITMDNSRLTFIGCNFELDASAIGSMIDISGYQATLIGCKFNSTKATAGTVYIFDFRRMTNLSSVILENCGAVYQAGGNQVVNPDYPTIRRNLITVIGGAANLTFNLPDNPNKAGILYNMPYQTISYNSSETGANDALSQIRNAGNGITFVDLANNSVKVTIAGSVKTIQTD